jgi:hypothetical protein
MKAYWESGGIATLIRPSALDGGGGQFHASAPLHSGKEPMVPTG